ncbi:DUF305 domain-containing protein [Luedemannella flava]|uniref:DUF305 domain-containing protein n=2 Tax=Luedemannella flava TaxID=349316 RepID=A0ABN2LYN9_9ACTN
MFRGWSLSVRRFSPKGFLHMFTARKALCVGAVGLVLALAGCSGGHQTGHPMPTMPHGQSAGASGTAAANQADIMFAQMMIPHHQQAVEMSELATGRVADAEVAALAAQIKGAQAPEIATMTGWLTAWGQPTHMPMDMGHGMAGMVSAADMAKLKAATGKEFDKLYATHMIAHHEGAITMARTELADGSNPEAKALAQQIITAQEAEIVTMKAILARL